MRDIGESWNPVSTPDVARASEVCDQLLGSTQMEPSYQWLAAKTLPCGEVVRFRDVSPDDDVLIAEAIRTASAETLLHRFFSPIRMVPLGDLRKLLTLDRSKGVCIVGVLQRCSETEIMCGARYVRIDAETNAAEIAITVHDRYQRGGLGAFLLKVLTEQARKDGIKCLTADVMGSNAGMIHLLRRTFPGANWSRCGEIYHFTTQI